LEHVDLFICKYTTLSTKPREKHPPLETLRLNAAYIALKSPQLEHIPLDIHRSQPCETLRLNSAYPALKSLPLEHTPLDNHSHETLLNPR
jgi:hypothetical protein